MQKTYQCSSSEETISLGKEIGSRLRGGEVIELVSDLGGGKTTFVRGLAQGFGSPDAVSSPSFTISYVYGRPDGKRIFHFDFYRLHDAGVVGSELEEVEGADDSVVIVEWGEIVHQVLPEERVKITIIATGEEAREFKVEYSEDVAYLFE